MSQAYKLRVGGWVSAKMNVPWGRWGVLENEQGRTREGGGGQNSRILSERTFWMSPFGYSFQFWQYILWLYRKTIYSYIQWSRRARKINYRGPYQKITLKTLLQPIVTRYPLSFLHNNCFHQNNASNHEICSHRILLEITASNTWQKLQ